MLMMINENHHQELVALYYFPRRKMIGEFPLSSLLYSNYHQELVALYWFLRRKIIGEFPLSSLLYSNYHQEFSSVVLVSKEKNNW